MIDFKAALERCENELIEPCPDEGSMWLTIQTALRIADRLQSGGFESFVHNGCVRYKQTSCEPHYPPSPMGVLCAFETMAAQMIKETHDDHTST